MKLLQKRQLLAHSLVGSGCEWLLRKWGTWSGLLVLNYHRIGNPETSPFDHDLWSATAEEFDWQVRHLKRDFDIVSPSDLDDVRRDRNGRFILITFDDGYRDNYELAFPVLHRNQVPATFFIATRFIDEPYISWWDEVAWMIRTTNQDFIEGTGWLPSPLLIDKFNPVGTIRALLKILKTLDGEKSQDFLNHLAIETGCGRCPRQLADGMWMTWDMIREMRAGGMTIGAHTVNHHVLSRLPIEQQRWEITESRRRLEEELGEWVDVFSYPVGGADTCTEETRTALQDMGFRWAFRYGVGFSTCPLQDPYQIPRLAVESSVNRSMFRSITTLPQLFD